MAGEESIIILQAEPARLRNNDVYFPYRQNSDFLYLTGFREPEALLVLLLEAVDMRQFGVDLTRDQGQWELIHEVAIGLDSARVVLLLQKASDLGLDGDELLAGVLLVEPPDR